MKKRLVIYFHYDPAGQVDKACRLAVSAMAKVAQAVVFVSNGRLESASSAWLSQQAGIRLLERENVGLDVGAYRQALLELEPEGLEGYEELVLMNYTLAGPVGTLEPMFEAMDQRPELDFWGLTRHYAMKSRRFGGKGGWVSEHLQSHFLAIRPRLFSSAAFWAYWRQMPLPKCYEESVMRHEVCFTGYFAAQGFRWDSFVNTDDLAAIYVNPIMACPRLLLEERGCPFFKRRSFFTPYADELRRTDGQASWQLYRYLKEQTGYPVEDLIDSLLRTQPLNGLARELHWRITLPESRRRPDAILREEDLACEPSLEPGKIYCLVMPSEEDGVARLCIENATTSVQVEQAAAWLSDHPEVGVLGPALTLAPEAMRHKLDRWRRDLPRVAQLCAQYGLTATGEGVEPLFLPNGGCLLVRGEAFADGLPPLADPAGWWLLPLLAQRAGYRSMVWQTAGQNAAASDLLEETLLAQSSIKGALRLLLRAVKRRLQNIRKGGQR